jgi:hypothetical protein
VARTVLKLNLNRQTLRANTQAEPRIRPTANTVYLHARIGSIVHLVLPLSGQHHFFSTNLRRKRVSDELANSENSALRGR